MFFKRRIANSPPIDWVGFDHCLIKDPKNDSSFISELTELKSKLSEQQRLVLIMDTHYIDFAHGDFGGISIKEMSDVVNSYYVLAKTEPRTIALRLFWPSGFDQEGSHGSRGMPDPIKMEYIKSARRLQVNEQIYYFTNSSIILFIYFGLELF